MQLSLNVLYSHSAEETIKYGVQIGKDLLPGSILCLMGDLGAGKTTFIKGLAQGAGQIVEREVSSPTFSYLHIYSGTLPIYHFDLYRLRGHEEFRALGFDEYLNGNGISCIEWAERIEAILPSNALLLQFAHEGEDRRKIVISRK